MILIKKNRNNNELKNSQEALKGGLNNENKEKNKQIINEGNMNKRDINAEKDNTTEHKYSPFDLVQFKSQRNKFLSLCIIWFIICGVYFGNTVNIKNLPGNIFVNSCINGIVEFSAMILGGYLMNNPSFGRKKTLIYVSISFFICYFIIAFFSNNFSLVFFSFIAKLALGAGLNILFVLSGESYPNTIKNYGYAFNTACGKTGALVLTFILELLTEFQVYSLFSMLGIVSFFLLLGIKETRGKPLVAEIPELVAN